MLARILDGSTVRTSTKLDDIRAALEQGRRVWIDLERRSPETDALLETLKLHPLTIEDIWAARSHPKIDDYDDYLYVIVHGISATTKDKKLKLAEIDVVIGKEWLVTYDRAGLCTDDVGTELDHSARVMEKGIAWLAHAVLDRAVDKYLPVIDELDGEIEDLENQVLDVAGTARGKKVLARILAFKRILQELRRTSIHQREILLRLSRGEFDEIPPEVVPFFRDVYDHFIRINDIAESYRDLVTSSLDAYLSVQSNRMNEIMKTLTLLSTVMLPLTFIAGVYGMNFDHDASPLNMPETKWYYGYPFALALMAVVAVGCIVYFRHKGWLRRSDEGDR